VRLVTFSEDSVYAGMVKVPAGMRVVIPEIGASAFLKACRKARLAPPRMSGIGHYVRHYCGQDLNGKTLVAWRGYGIGDQVMWSAILRALKWRWPGATIVNYAHPRLFQLWAGQPYFECLTEPIPFADWKAADYHLIGEDLSETDFEPDADSHIDLVLRRCGLDPAAIPAAEKLPVITVSQEARSAAAAWLHAYCPGVAPASPRPLILWQLASSNLQRAYPPVQTQRALRLLAKTLPGAAIVIVARSKDLAHYPHLRLPPGGVLCLDQPLSTVFALLERAALVICPDSCIGHAAAAFPQVPVLSLWGPWPPAFLATYYANHVPLRSPFGCAPCRLHACGLYPRRRHCAGLAAITPLAIVHKAVDILFTRAGGSGNPDPAQTPAPATEWTPVP